MEAFERLRAIYFFEHLTPEQLAQVADACRRQTYVAGDDVLVQGEQTSHFFIVDAGYVNLRHTDRNGFEQPIGSKGPGEYFGIKMFTNQELSEHTFEAVDAATLWVLDREPWDRLLEEHPDILENMPELRAEYARLAGGLDWLSPGEVIDLSTRRHWWALVLMVRLPLLVGILFSAAYFVSDTFGVTRTLSQVLYVYAGVMFLVLLWMVWEGLNWYNDTYIVTNKRVVRINKVLFFSDSRQDLAIGKIQSQRVERGGPISVLLNISDLYITSAAVEGQGMVFEQVGNVLRIQKAIENERLHVAERNRATEREQLRGQIAREIKHYVFQQPNPPEIPAPPLPVTRKGLRARLLRRRRAAGAPGKPKTALWNRLVGTELREGNLVTWRKHHIVLLQQTLPGLGALTVLLLLTIFLMTSGLPFDLASGGVFMVLVALAVVALADVLWEWEDWRNDLYKLSGAEIVDIESLPFGLRYQEKKAELKNIQDVTTSRLRFLNVLLDYGNVESRVGGNAPPFVFLNVAHPRRVADEIVERIETLKVRATENANREQTRSIVDAIVAYHRLLMAERHQTGPDAGAAPAGLNAGASAPGTAALMPPATPESPADVPYIPPRPRTFLFPESEFPSETDLG